MKKAVVLGFLTLLLLAELFIILYTEKLGIIYKLSFDKVFLVGAILYFIAGFYLLINSKKYRKHRYLLTASTMALMLLPHLIVSLTCYKKELITHLLLKFETHEIQVKTSDNLVLNFKLKNSASPRELPKECIERRSGPFGVIYVRFLDCPSNE